MTGLQAVESLALYINNNTQYKTYKVEKTTNQAGEYIVVNHLPFAFGSPVNDDNVLNVNIHVPKMSTGVANIARLEEVLTEIIELIPLNYDDEDTDDMFLDGAYYSITSISQPMEDTDDTYFLNIKVKIIF